MMDQHAFFAAMSFLLMVSPSPAVPVPKVKKTEARSVGTVAVIRWRGFPSRVSRHEVLAYRFQQVGEVRSQEVLQAAADQINLAVAKACLHLMPGMLGPVDLALVRHKPVTVIWLERNVRVCLANDGQAISIAMRGQDHRFQAIVVNTVAACYVAALRDKIDLKDGIFITSRYQKTWNEKRRVAYLRLYNQTLHEMAIAESPAKLADLEQELRQFLHAIWHINIRISRYEMLLQKWPLQKAICLPLPSLQKAELSR